MKYWCYFKLVNTVDSSELPDPRGPLSSAIPPLAFEKAANANIAIIIKVQQLLQWLAVAMHIEMLNV